MNAARYWMGSVVAGMFGWVCSAGADQMFKANNALPLNDPLSWESGVVPGAGDVAVFDERVTTNTVAFALTNDLAWAGVVFTNSVAPTNVMIGTVIFATNGADAAVLTLGSNGVCVIGSGLALTLNVPLALSAAQTWQVDRKNLTFNSPVSGTADWTLNLSSQVLWNVAAGYSGNVMVSNAFAVTRFTKTGQWAKSLTQKWGGRLEMTFTNSALWSSLFLDRTATFNCWNGLTAGGTLQFENGDTFNFPNSGSRFTLDNGNVIQNGGTLNGYEAQVQYYQYDCRYAISGGSFVLAGGLILGNGLQYVNGESRFLQKGGSVSVNSVKAGWVGCKYVGVNTYEMTGGVFRITGTRGADTGVHLSWNDMGSAPENSGAFLMEGGWADVDQIAFGRSEVAPAYATTNAFSLFKMTGGELVLGSRGLYAARSWNNGLTNSGYAVKLQGGTLTAGDSWSSQLDVFLSDSNGGTAFNTADTNGVGQRVVLNGAVYGPGSLTKSGNGTLVLAGEAAYAGKTTVKAGTLMVGGTSSASDCYRWVADSMTDTNTPVAVWTDVNVGVPATNAVASQTPRLVCGEINGHNVVRFTSGASQYLAIEAAKSPVSGATNFSIVVVFKTGTSGYGSNGYWYSNTGLVDGEQGGIQNDWGMVYTGLGCVGGGAGYPAINKDFTVYSSSSYSVADSQPHVAIYTWQGTNMLVNVDGRVTTGVSTSAVVSARNSYRMLFGSVALEGGKYFNGDMAEIRIYRNRALTADEQNRIGSGLSATYGVPGAVFAEPASVASSAGEVAAAASSGSVSPLAYDASVWDADTLTGANGSAVTSWASTNGTRAATQTDAVYLEGLGSIGGAAPTLAVGAINGHNAVHFTGSARSALGISAANNPLAGVTNFSVAVVFRTDNGYGPYSTNRQWWECTGLIDAEEPGVTNDWGLALTSNGRVAAGIGGGDATVYSRPFDLDDGVVHVAVVSYNAAGGYTAVMADGLYIIQSEGSLHAMPRNIKRLLLGSINGQGGQFLTGDLATFRLYPERALTVGEMTSVSTELASKYGVRFVSRSNVLAPQPTGLGGGDVQVSSGASLVLPTSTNAAVTLGPGQTIYGGGTVRGTLALNSGATVDIGLTEALTMDALWLNTGATVRWRHLGSAGITMSVESLKASGTVAVQVEGGTDLPVRVALIAYTAGANLSSATWTVSGGKSNTRVEVNAAAKTIDLVTPKGTMMVVR
jgi:autotransporter-associated beta strand protein